MIDDTILFDTFSNYPVLARKLRKADVDLESIQSVVISHGHWDHVGGLWTLLEKRQGIEVYLPSSVKGSVKRRVVTAGGRMIDASGVKTLKENIFLSGEMIGAFKGKPVAEQFIVIKTDKGLVVLVGCSHPHILTIVKNTKEWFGLPVYGVFGGFHLMHASIESILNCANALKNEGVEMIAPTHCTGWRAERVFKKVFGKGFVALGEGQSVSL